MRTACRHEERRRLLDRGDHVLDSRAEVGVGAVRAGPARRHRVLAIDSAVQQAVDTLPQAGLPGRLVTKLRRTRYTRGVADETGPTIDRFAGTPAPGSRRGCGRRGCCRWHSGNGRRGLGTCHDDLAHGLDALHYGFGAPNRICWRSLELYHRHPIDQRDQDQRSNDPEYGRAQLHRVFLAHV